MINKDKYFTFYNSCIPVKGIKRSVIYDLQRGNIFFIPNSIIDLLLLNKKNKLIIIYDQYQEQTDLLDKYFNYLLKNELIFLTEELNRFPVNSTKFQVPFTLDILFLEIDLLQESKIDLLKKINFLGCTQVVFLTKKGINFKNLKKVINILNRSKVQNINLITKYKEEHLSSILNLHYGFPRFKKTTFFDCPSQNKSKEPRFKFESKSFDCILTKRISNINDFVLNQKAYTESLKYNLFFNRKVYVDNVGNIKNYYNSKNIFGNIDKDDIKLIVDSKSFKELWKLSKDKIKICNFCEFRYICPDNRIPKIKDDKIKNKLYQQNSNCNYDPKTTSWK